MRHIFSVVVATLALTFATISCGTFDSLTSTNTSSGTPYELVVVCAQPQWQSELGDTLQVILKQPVRELMQFEPMYDVIRILPNNFKSLTRRHRNIIQVNVDPSITETNIAARYNYTAEPQVFINIQGPDSHTVAQYVSENRENLLYVLEKAERDRTISYSTQYHSQPMLEMIKERFGIDMYIPDDYKLCSQYDDMLWISQEYPFASKGFFIYKYPYKGLQSLSSEALMKARDRFAQRIPGPADGSYMITVDKIADTEDETGEKYIPFTPEYRTLRIGDRPWIEMAGLWDVENYFMGGPYVSYTTVNEQTQEVITIDCYVYSPKEKKRNFLRDLQHLVYLVNFPSDKAAEATTTAESATATTSANPQ